MYILAGNDEVLRDEIIYIAHRAAHPEKYPIRKGAVRGARRQQENLDRYTEPTKVQLPNFPFLHLLIESPRFIYKYLMVSVSIILSVEVLK
jgi:hypothetical protein